MIKNIVLIGMPGCGKSTIGQLLSEKTYMDFIDTDQEIERTHGLSIFEIFEKNGENVFREYEKICVKNASERNNCVISTGGGVVLEEINMQNLKKSSMIIYLKRSIETILNDVKHDSRPLLAKNPQKIVNIYIERKDLYEKYADVCILNENNSEDAVFQCLRYFNDNK